MTAELKPAIDAVEASKPRLKVDRVTGIERPCQGFNVSRKIIGMNRAVGFPVCEFVQRLAEVAEELLVEAFDFATRPEDRDKARNGVDDQA